MVCGRGLHPLACHSRSSEFTTPSHTLNGKFDLPNSRSLYDFFPLFPYRIAPSISIDIYTVFFSVRFQSSEWQSSAFFAI